MGQPVGVQLPSLAPPLISTSYIEFLGSPCPFSIIQRTHCAKFVLIFPSRSFLETSRYSVKHPMKLKDRGAVNARSEEAAIREAPINEKGKGGYFDLGAELETVKSGRTRDQQPIGGGENLRKPTPISSTRSMDPDFDCNPAVERLEGDALMMLSRSSRVLMKRNRMSLSRPIH